MLEIRELLHRHDLTLYFLDAQLLGELTGLELGQYWFQAKDFLEREVEEAWKQAVAWKRRSRNRLRSTEEAFENAFNT